MVNSPVQMARFSYKKKITKTHSPEVGEPLDQLGGVVLVELDVREVHLEDGRARVPNPEEHQLRLAQMHRGQCRRVQRS